MGVYVVAYSITSLMLTPAVKGLQGVNFGVISVVVHPLTSTLHHTAVMLKPTMGEMTLKEPAEYL